MRDVVEGWSHPKAGPGGELVGAVEFEKGLRKTAQRGGTSRIVFLLFEVRKGG